MVSSSVDKTVKLVYSTYGADSRFILVVYETNVPSHICILGGKLDLQCMAILFLQFHPVEHLPGIKIG